MRRVQVPAAAMRAGVRLRAALWRQRRGGGGSGAAQFAGVHKVFGASNVAKMLSRVPVALRRDAASTVCYEAQARIADPVYGCVGTILALQHQVNVTTITIPYHAMLVLD